MSWNIYRENNKYNKAKKWHIIGNNCSFWYNTRKEAEMAINRFKKAETKYNTEVKR